MKYLGFVSCILVEKQSMKSIWKIMTHLTDITSFLEVNVAHIYFYNIFFE